MAPITMDSGVLAYAAKLYETARSSAESTIKALGNALDSNEGCAGTDSAGKTWADSYDPAAFKAVAAGANTVNGFGKLHDLLAFTSVNHANTEKANKTPPESPGPDPAQLPTSTAPSFKGAFGGDSDPPFGWALISSWLQGHTWPNGDPDKLRALGSAWQTAASGLRSASGSTGAAWSKLEGVTSGEMSQAAAQMDIVSGAVEEVATQYEKLGAACDDWADKIEDAHRKIFNILAGALAVGLGAGILVGLFTAGTGTALVGAGAGGSAGASIVGILVAFNGAAAVAVGTTVAAGVAAGAVAAELQPLLQANPIRYEPGEAPPEQPPSDSQVGYNTRPERLNHTFAPKHNLDGVVSRSGGREGAVRAMLDALKGKTPEGGVFEKVVNISGENVTVRGFVDGNGIIKISTAFIP